MKTGFIFLLSGAVLLVAAFFILHITIANFLLEFHINNTYYVADVNTVLLVVVLFLAALFLIGLAVNKRRNLK